MWCTRACSPLPGSEAASSLQIGVVPHHHQSTSIRRSSSRSRPCSLPAHRRRCTTARSEYWRTLACLPNTRNCNALRVRLYSQRAGQLPLPQEIESALSAMRTVIELRDAVASNNSESKSNWRIEAESHSSIDQHAVNVSGSAMAPLVERHIRSRTASV